MQKIALVLGAALLAGCATTPAPKPAPPPPPPPGMELLLQQPPETALALLGKPRLDRREGPARQLQFAGGCLLDIWFYPQSGATLLATHADARLANGRDLAAGDCLQMLLRAKEALATPAPPPPQPQPAKPQPRKRG